jgi:hypothetical protein
MFSLTTIPVHCCSIVTSLTSSPAPVTLLAKRTYVSEYYCWYVSCNLRDRNTEALWSPVRTAVLQQNVVAKSLDNQFEITYSTTVCWTYHNGAGNSDVTSDFVGAGVSGQSCGCETAQGILHWDYGLLVWHRVVRQTHQHKIPKRTRYWGCSSL